MRGLAILLATSLLAGCSSDADDSTTAVQTTPAPPTTATAPTVTPPPPPPPPPPASPLPPPQTNGLPADVAGFAQGGTLAASDLRGQARCEQSARRRAVADLTWRPASRPGDEQRIVVALDPAQFGVGAYDASKAMDPAVGSFLWTRVRGASVHTWRVLTRHGATWTSSAPARFEGELCEADFQPPG
jgi:hypothetical protein